MISDGHAIGSCSICGSPGTNMTTCPLNPLAINHKPRKHSNCHNKVSKKYIPKFMQKGGNKNNQVITLKDLRGLQWRVQNEQPTSFYPPGVEFCGGEGKETSPGVIVFDMMTSINKMDEMDKKYSWNTSEWKNRVVDFGTSDKVLTLKFRDNPKSKTFTMTQPITLEQLVDGIRKHFKEVDLVDSPDNGIFDFITKKDGIYNISTAS
jgi:hypothetical protein